MLEGDRGVLEGLALHQPGEEEVPLGPQRQLVVEVEVVLTGEEPAGLELDEGGGDEQELGGDVQAEVLHGVELGQVGVDDLGEGDVVELYLLAQDQVQQQVEGTFEDRRRHLVGHRAQC